MEKTNIGKLIDFGYVYSAFKTLKDYNFIDIEETTLLSLPSQKQVTFYPKFTKIVYIDGEIKEVAGVPSFQAKIKGETQ